MSEPDDGARRGSIVVRWTGRALTALLAVVMFAMMMLVTLDVAGRALFNYPIRGSFEIVQFMLAIVIFAALPLVSWDDKHITVNLFDSRLSEGVRRWLGVALGALSTVIVAFMAERLWIQGRLMDEGQHVTGFLEWPVAPIAYFMSLCSALTALILAVLTWRKATGRAPPTSGGGGSGAIE